ncbi:MAG TPA: aminoglycoside phosphotransferase family protein [Acidimicrobiia bacterium]|jgi:spectinomycin phosphotransferase
MRSRPSDLDDERLLRTLDAGWGLRAGSLTYVPEGGGSHHWTLVGDDGRHHFVTVDELDDKDWMADTRPAVLDGLGRALRTACALRDLSGLEFVVAPVIARDGGVLQRIDDRYVVSVFPYLTGHSYPFGPYPDAELRHRALDLVAALHRATPVVRDLASRPAPRFGGERDLAAFLADPTRPWNAGPFSELTRARFAQHGRGLEQLVAGFAALIDRTEPARSNPVITHGEPHPGNLMCVDDGLVLIDWDTVALAAPERDLALIVTDDEDGERYQQATGHTVDGDAITLYRLRWYLDDLASAVRMFRHPHRATADTRRWSDGVEAQLEQLPSWLARVG